jgi:DNA-binding CsgD family transcriptional regulator
MVTGSADAVSFNSVHLYEDDPAIINAYAQIAHEDFAALAMIASQGVTLNLNMSELCTTHGRRGLRDYTHKVRHDNALISCAGSNTGFFRSVSLYKGDDDNQFSEAERRACEIIFPHLIEAQAVNMALNLPRFDSSATRRWPMAVCDALGHLHYVEKDFLALLRAQWSRLDAHRLPAPLVVDLMSRGMSCFKAENVYVERVAICGSMHILKARERLGPDALTVRELEVATHSARGLNYREIAEVLTLSPTTVRNHLQRIHERLDIRSNAQLARELQSAYP